MGALAIIGLAGAVVGAIGGAVSESQRQDAARASAREEASVQHAQARELWRQASVAENIGNLREANFAQNTDAQLTEMRIQGNRARGAAAARSAASGTAGTSALGHARQIVADSLRKRNEFRRDRTQQLDIMTRTHDEQVDQLNFRAGLLNDEANATMGYYSSDDYRRSRNLSIFGAALGGGAGGASAGASTARNIGLQNDWTFA